MTFRSYLPIIVGVALTACGGGEPFDVQTAMDLMRDRADIVRITFSAAPHFAPTDVRLATAYKKMMDGRLIQCKESPLMGVLCEPGPAGDALKQENATELSLIAGKWMPAAVLSLRRTGRNTANADIRMAFEPSQTLREFGDAMDLIQPPGYLLAQSTWKDGKVVHVTFQHFEDGWHTDTVTE